MTEYMERLETGKILYKAKGRQSKRKGNKRKEVWLCG